VEVPGRAEVIAAREALWHHGIVASWYLRPSQLDIYDLLHRAKNPFIEAARRFGKTTTILAYVLERLRANPGWICRWCEPWKEQAREIVMPELDKLQAECPEKLKFRFQVTGSVYIGPGNSRLYLRGVNEDRGESARGPTAHIIVADEFGSWRDAEYTVNEVLRPQLLTTNGQFVFASSPAADLAHQYYEHKARAIRESRFIQKTIYDNESLSPEKIKEIIQEVGGEHKPAWRREYLCQEVSDPERLVIPEYQEEVHDIEDDHPRPEFFDCYDGMDLALNPDYTGALFAYVDFEKHTLVIDDELFVNGRNTKFIVEECREKERSLWGTLDCRCALPDTQNHMVKYCTQHGIQPYMRWADNELQQLFDMSSEHGFNVAPTRKDDKLAALAELRLSFTRGHIKIKKRCKNLRYQLKVGLWDLRGKSFQRGDKIGHLDLIDALIYLHRNISWSHNPYPRYPGTVTPYTHFIPEVGPQGSNASGNDLARVFEPFGGAFGQNR
jgi:hypothetical protein